MNEKMSSSSIAALGKARIETLSDGIFATAMTIMILTLVVPVVTGTDLNSQLISNLAALLPNFLIYLTSFFLLGLIWILHNNIFHYIRSVDRKFLWLNILFLLFIGILPFTTALIGRYPFQQAAVIVYGLNLFAISLSINLAWLYAVSGHRLVNKDLDSSIIGIQTKRGMVSVLFYFIAILLAFANVEISLALYVLVPVIYLIVGRLE